MRSSLSLPHRATLLAFLLSVFVPGLALHSAAGQTANVERLRVGPESPGFQGGFNVGLSLQEGNTDTFGIQGDLRLTWALLGSRKPDEAEIQLDPPHCHRPEEPQKAEGWTIPKDCFNQRVWLFTASAKFSEENDERSTNEAFGHLRWTRMRSPRWGYEAFGQMQFNEFLRLDRRSLLGGGFRFRLLRSPQQELFVGTGYMVEVERLDVPEDGPDEPKSTNHRWTNYLSWKRTIGARQVRLGNTVYFQPRLDAPDDFRALNESTLEVNLTEKLSLGLHLRIAHDNRPPVDVEKTDYSLSNSLRYRF